MREPTLVASTGTAYNTTIADYKSSQKPHSDHLTSGSKDEVLRETNYFKSLQWSPDGTTLLATSASNSHLTFILPTDLLDPAISSPHSLNPYTIIASPEPIYASTAYPHFDLSDSNTTILLSSHRDHPTRLTNVLDPASSILATYPLVNPTTEAYETPHSLLFLPDGTSFLTGTTSQISVFDTQNTGHGPTVVLPTIPSRRHKSKGGGVGMRGIVSSLALQSTSEHGDGGVLAAGTWTRSVGLYDAQGMGGTIATWSVEDAADSEAGIGGQGVSQVAWSGCGRYLLVAERKSEGVLVYDVRVTGKVVGWLGGRKAATNQRMGIQAFEGTDGCEVWAGGTDGVVRVWEGVGLSHGQQMPTWEWTTHGDAVGGVALHPGGNVVATCSGQRRELGTEFEDSEDTDKHKSRGSPKAGDDSLDDDQSDIGISYSNSPKRKHAVVDNSVKVWSLF